LKSSLELVLNEEGRKKYFRDFGIKPFLLGYEIYQSKLSLLLLLLLILAIINELCQVLLTAHQIFFDPERKN
jgi:hypothetical protein